MIRKLKWFDIGIIALLSAHALLKFKCVLFLTFSNLNNEQIRKRYL